jgi:hypothetical protein
VTDSAVTIGDRLNGLERFHLRSSLSNGAIAES